MRHVIKVHRELGDIDIAGIDLGRNCRDDMPSLLELQLTADHDLLSSWKVYIMRTSLVLITILFLSGCQTAPPGIGDFISTITFAPCMGETPEQIENC